ncbi:hypothetical protein DZ860_00745 [Vibrio sinensis]|uniref:Uncharacterized protein n=1 Tax=Vibrio sinensis TaxID=2302434 RepID=A0A3A6QXI2_9VIBR|nr:hypothetical protein [Vibrio sinensis]RJX75246.1 hypothetical protein DZ860_00745 [Vibrio sinensis]
MKKFLRLDLLGAVCSLLSYIYLLGHGSSHPLWQWPLEALHGAAFTFAWGFGASKSLAYVLSIITFIAVTVSGYLLGKIISRWLSRYR